MDGRGLKQIIEPACNRKYLQVNFRHFNSVRWIRKLIEKHLSIFLPYYHAPSKINIILNSVGETVKSPGNVKETHTCFTFFECRYAFWQAHPSEMPLVLYKLSHSAHTILLWSSRWLRTDRNINPHCTRSVSLNKYCRDCWVRGICRYHRHYGSLIVPLFLRYSCSRFHIDHIGNSCVCHCDGFDVLFHFSVYGLGLVSEFTGFRQDRGVEHFLNRSCNTH